MAMHCGYSSGHPWYYFLGGKPLMPRAILEETRHSGYRGYARADIETANRLPEPKRSESLRRMRAKFMSDLKSDLSRYRACVRQLRRMAEASHCDGEIRSCRDIDVSLSLKHNHLVNDFGHLILLDDLQSVQRDLFDL